MSKPTLAETLDTERLLMSVPTAADAAPLNAAIAASYPELNAWMDWAAEPNPLSATEAFCTGARSAWEKSDEMSLVLRLKDGTVIGSGGLVRADWRVPRVEIGYWCHTAHVGNGYITEAARAMTEYALDTLRCERVEIRADIRNTRSWAVADRLGYVREAVLQRDTRANDGTLRDTVVYAIFERSQLL